MCRDEILAQLTELFGDYIDQQRIVATIEKFDNDLDLCIETLLKDEEETMNGSDKHFKSEPKAEPADDGLDGPDPSTGATRKATYAMENQSEMPASFASFLQKGSGSPLHSQQASFSNNPPRRGQGKHQPSNLPPNFQHILDMVGQGYRVMVLMRGAPGSGKSFLSRTLINSTSGGDFRNHIFSTDDYFMVNGMYKFQSDALDAAHRFNQSNVQAKARDGCSPIVVDNTNIRLWEMFPYVHIAADHGYHLEVLEPTTHWRNNSRSLAIRNTHGVPEPKIKSMLQNYEKLTDVKELFRLCKLENTLYIPSKMRHYPILPQDYLIPTGNKNRETHSGSDASRKIATWNGEWEDRKVQNQTDQNEMKPEILKVDLANIPLPKPPREAQKRPTLEDSGLSPRHVAIEEGDVASAAISFNQEADFSWDFTEDWRKSDSNWTPYDTESNHFWGQSAASDVEYNKSTVMIAQTEARPQRTLNPNHEPITEFLLSSVKLPTQGAKNQEGLPKSTTTFLVGQGRNEQPPRKTDKKRIALIKHCRGCPNENAGFSEICNLYPKVPDSYLWDLFEKCSGDGDWVASLLLEEQKFENFENVAEQEGIGAGRTAALGGASVKWKLLECNCNEPVAKEVHAPVLYLAEAENETDILSSYTASSSQSTRETIRRGQGQRDGMNATKKEIEARFVLSNEHFSEHIQKIRLARGIVTADQVDESPPQEFQDLENDGEKATDSEVVELRLGVELVKQLHSIFKDKHCPKSFELDKVLEDRTRVFMATEMAEQLYLLFLDSMYSYREEEKLFNLREDERMARLMETEERYPALFKPQDPSGVPNLKDIIEMEEALAAYQKETNATWQKSVPQDLAQQMSQQKLQQMFPHVDSADLLQILAAHNNRFDETVQVLNASIPETVRRQMLEKEELLKQRAEGEKQKLVDLFSSPSFVTPSPSSPSLSGEEAINFHLITAEECRNLAQHHLDLKNECHEKARAAIQRNVPGLADYYSQIARLHKTKIDMYNSRASNCIMEVHKLKLNNEEVLDLHYLHSQEALSCLELFLAAHASKLLNSQQRFKTLYIITGRGLHSADGKPIIKQRVKAMLRLKNIRYMELNPGFLKIKLFNREDLEQLVLTS